jgi:hypothetical protein
MIIRKGIAEDDLPLELIQELAILRRNQMPC